MRSYTVWKIGCSSDYPFVYLAGVQTLTLSQEEQSALRRYLRTWSPWYDPAKIVVPEGVDALLTKFSARVETLEAAS